MREYRNINPVLSKTLRVLGHTELFEPVRNLLHRGPSPRSSYRATGQDDGKVCGRYPST